MLFPTSPVEVSPSVAAPPRQAAAATSQSMLAAAAAYAARPQLPSAVLTPSHIAALPPQLPKSSRPLLRRPSSTFVAQLIAQDASISREALQAFDAPLPE